MTTVTLHAATWEDVCHVAGHLRQADIDELRLAQPEDPAEAVRQSYGHSLFTRVARVDGVPAVLYGVSPTPMEGCGSPWLLATDDIHRIRRAFVRGSLRELDAVRQPFRLLWNQVHRQNAASLRWLRWLGFRIDPAPAGPRGEFFDFWMEGACVTR